MITSKELIHCGHLHYRQRFPTLFIHFSHFFLIVLRRILQGFFLDLSEDKCENTLRYLYTAKIATLLRHTAARFAFSWHLQWLEITQILGNRLRLICPYVICLTYIIRLYIREPVRALNLLILISMGSLSNSPSNLSGLRHERNSNSIHKYSLSYILKIRESGLSRRVFRKRLLLFNA